MSDTMSDTKLYRIPREGEVIHHSNKDVMPVSESNNYVQIEKFLNKLSVQQLQEAEIEKLILLHS